MDRFTQFSVAATKLALNDADLTITDELSARTGSIIGSGIGGIATLEQEANTLFEKGMGRISPFFVPMMIANMGTGTAARIFNAKGPSECVVTACATSTNAIGDAYKIILRGDADVMIAGGSEAAVTPLGMAGFSNMKALSRRNDNPTGASRPFDKGRDGFVLGEGAGVVILEERDMALARGATIYAEVVGYGMSNDAYDMVAPNGLGAQAAMQAALKDAQLTPEQIDHINPHATSTPAGDVMEARAIKAVFGDHAYKMPISATKSMTGHLLGGAGAIEIIAAALALQTGEVPPTINLSEPDEDCDLDFVPNHSRKVDIKTAMSNSFGFGGHNASVILSRG